MKVAELGPNDVVITGRGIVSPIGNSLAEVDAAQREGRSGVAFDPEMAARGFRSCVSGRVRNLDAEALFPAVRRMSMSRASLYSSAAAQQAVRESGLTEADCAREETGVVMGTGAAGLATSLHNYEKFQRDGSPRRLGGHAVDTTMASTCAANATVLFKTKGIGESLSSACATGLHCIGHAYRSILHGYQDTVIAGSAEEDGWEVALGFDAMRILCADSNDHPERASRPFDASRSGFVVAGGAAAVVLESYAHVAARGARPLARIAGYWSSSDGSGSMVQPSLEGQVRVMGAALRAARLEPARIDYVNLHGTSTTVGDSVELQALGAVMGTKGYAASSSKSLFGHAVAATAAIEVVLTTLMLQQQYVAPSINIERLDAGMEDFSSVLVRESRPKALRFALSNNFGFGNTNASLVLEAIEA